MGATDIRQLLPQNITNGLLAANSPSAGNPFATINDITGSTVVPLDPVISTTTEAAAIMITGNRYIASANGAIWIMNNIYEWDGAAWIETIPVTDNIVEDIAAGINKRYDGSLWVNYGSISLLQGGNNIASVYMGSKAVGGVTYIRANGTTARARFTNTQMNITGNLYLGSLTAAATAKLHVAGTLRFVTGNQGAGKVLVSDASGNADWTTLISGWALNGNTVGSVKSIGTIDAYDFPIITTNVEVARFYANGKFSIGQGASISDISSVAIGYGAITGVNREVAIGYTASATSQGVSIGYAANTNDRGVAIGYNATNTGTGVSIGESATAVGGISIKGTSVASNQIAIFASVTGNGIIAIGSSSVASGDSGIALGVRTRALATDSYIIGRSATNGDFLDNNTAQSFGIGWAEVTPTVLFAKTADQYIGGSGGLVIGATTVSAVAQLEVTSTTKGFRITPMTSAQASAITPTEGLMVCVSDTDATFIAVGFWGYQGGLWVKM